MIEVGENICRNSGNGRWKISVCCNLLKWRGVCISGCNMAWSTCLSVVPCGSKYIK